MSSSPIPPEARAAWAAQDRQREARPELSLERIVEASVRIADADGLAAVSMARVAKELGFATMALYRHVGSKDALLVHMQDTAYGEPPATSPSSLGWRDGMVLFMRGLLEAHLKHPWVLEIPLSTPPLMPQSLKWMDWALAVMTDLPLEPFEKLSTMLLLSGYARNEAATAAMIGDMASPQNENVDVDFEAGLRTLTGPDRLPAVHALVMSGRLFEMPAEATSDDGDEFILDFGLGRILDGLEALIVKRKPNFPTV
ncbi:TetR/AcrR family transcriptional regulator [Pseudonocardia sp. TRM90224]|uniref:TetR/AcrR family transcriptional regulator n=1 Tax=Pseudonocardia sp. TRM90224 TaxID=2812678 RepID=UPI001E45F47E|nr:TetR/AcrR family transcriptional regulator [Pseudonocardia sp. TRM90224]